MKPKDYDKEYDSLFIHFGKNKTVESVELRNVEIILDFDKNLNIVGFEIMDFIKRLREHEKRMDKIWRIRNEM